MCHGLTFYPGSGPELCLRVTLFNLGSKVYTIFLILIRCVYVAILEVFCMLVVWFKRWPRGYTLIQPKLSAVSITIKELQVSITVKVYVLVRLYSTKHLDLLDLRVDIPPV